MSDWLLAAGRGAHLAGTLTLAGSLLFRALILQAGAARGLRRLEWSGLLAAAAGLSLWLAAQAWGMADGTGLAVVLATIIGRTWFGHVLALRMALLLAACLAWRRPRLAAAAAAAGVALQGAIGHGAAMDGLGWLAAAEALHVMAAALWLGGLAPLALALPAAPEAAARRLLARFSNAGLVAIPVLAATALAQGLVLIGDLPRLIGTEYGRLAGGKLGLFAVLLALAAANRWVLAPRLARRWLAASIWTEVALGLGLVGLAAAMASSVPAMHAEPGWPFAWRPSLDAWAEPDLRWEIATGGAGAAAAMGLLVAAAASRRWRILAAGAALGLTRVAAPHLGLLLVPAYPTSYAEAPEDPAAPARGAALYPVHCAPCHGADGHGDGPRAAGLAVPPADLTAHLMEHPPGELFWWVAHGIAGPDGRPTMPGFGEALGSDDVWALVGFIRNRAGGTAPAASGHHH